MLDFSIFSYLRAFKIPCLAEHEKSYITSRPGRASPVDSFPLRVKTHSEGKRNIKNG